MKRHRIKIITGVVVAAALVFTFWYGGNAPGMRGWTANAGSRAASNDAAGDVSSSTAPDSPGTPESPAQDARPIADGALPESGSAEEAPEQAPAGARTTTPYSPQVEIQNNTQGDTLPETNEDTSEELPDNTSEETSENTSEEALEDPSEQPSDESPEPPGSHGADFDGPLTADEKVALAAEIAGGSSEGVEEGDKGYSQLQGMAIDSVTGKDQYMTNPVPEGRPAPVEPQNAEITNKSFSVLLSVRCDTILENINWLDKEKWELVPEDGVIFPLTEVIAYEGESVFDVLQREMRRARIHMEFRNTPMYNSAYIQGINNLYEFDVGELSGWMYKVDDWFPNYGCSRYQLQPGDVIEWVYTCDLGIDVGGFYAING